MLTTGAGYTAIFNVCAEPAPQLLTAATLTTPPVFPAVIVMLSVALLPVNPVGSDHEYASAPTTAGTLRVKLVLGHTIVSPTTADGCASILQSSILASAPLTLVPTFVSWKEPGVLILLKLEVYPVIYILPLPSVVMPP